MKTFLFTNIETKESVLIECINIETAYDILERHYKKTINEMKIMLVGEYNTTFKII